MKQATPLVPALRSNWLMMHVSIMMISYASLIIGSLLSISISNNYHKGKKYRTCKVTHIITKLYQCKYDFSIISYQSKTNKTSGRITLLAKY